MHSRRWRRISVAAAATAGVAAVGIAVSISSGTATARSNPTLVVYSAQGYDKSMVAAFHKKYPNIPVTLNDNSTGPLLTQIEAERNNPRWGLLWVDGTTAFAGLDQQHLLARNVAFNTRLYNSLGHANVPRDRSFAPTGVTLVPGVASNISRVHVPPTTLSGLLAYAKAHHGKVGMNDPTQSGPTYPLIAGIMNYLGHGNVARGEARGKSYFLQLKKYGLSSNGTNGTTLPQLDNGTFNIALVQSSAAIGDSRSIPTKAGGNPANRAGYLAPATELPSAIGIDAKAPAAVKAEAVKFIDFTLSKAGQHVMQTGDPWGDSLYYPVVNGVRPRRGLPSLAKVKTQAINPYAWGPLERSINAWWVSHIIH
jgi:iron(III) transport system substrate-binding protein